MALALAIGGALHAAPPEPAPRRGSAAEAFAALRGERPAARVLWDDAGPRRLYGTALDSGASPRASAESFLADHAAIFGVARADLVPRGPHAGGASAVGLMHDPVTRRPRFVALRYAQQHQGIDVFGGRLTLLVRNERGHALVLASSSLRDLGGLAIVGGAAPPDPAAAAARVLGPLGWQRIVEAPELVIWAGDGQPAPPRRALRIVAQRGEPASAGFDKSLLLLDADTAELLHAEPLILHAGISGTVAGMATAETGADSCGSGALTGLPWAEVRVDGETFYTDADGAFEIDWSGGAAVVQSPLRGLHFQVHNQAGVEGLITHVVQPDQPVQLVHNATDQFEFERAQVNAYLHANLVRDFVLSVNPEFPEIAGQNDFPVNVNIDNDCNAFYDPQARTINFFTSGGGCANTAFDTVVYHEYGHHLVNVGGSGQGAYGEGMSDTVALLMSDEPLMGRGWHTVCNAGLRDADNDCRYDPVACTSNCGTQIHACGRLISGTIWSLRNELAASEPEDYRQILCALTLNSILLHTGSSIDPSIAIDFLTLDDDNATLLDGTPHHVEIAAAFAAHGLDAPPLVALGFDFPLGVPSVLPERGAAVRVRVTPLAGQPVEGSVTLHVELDDGAGFQALPMAAVAPETYEGLLPGAPCGTRVRWYVSAASTTGTTQTAPPGAPGEAVLAVAAAAVDPVLADDFEDDFGWSVQSSAGLGGGAWQRGAPAGDGSRGDPVTDADGSGQCFLTGNAAGDSDVDGGSTALRSPALTVSGPLAQLSYSRWLSTTAGNAPHEDVLVVEASGDGGATWVELETVGPGGPEVSGGWIDRQWPLDAIAAAGDELRVRFTVSDMGAPSIVEAAIDAVVVRSYVCEGACAADATGDDMVNVDDLLAILVAWGTSDAAADINGSGAVDIDDLVAVVTGWGCGG